MSDETTTTETVDTPAPETATPEATGEPTEGLETAAEGDAAAEGEGAEKGQPEANKLIAALLRKRSRLRAENARLAQARSDFERQQAEAVAQLRQAEQVRQLAQRAAQGDDEALRALGIDYDQLTIRRLRAGTPEAKLEAMQAQLEAERTARVERERAAQEAAQQAQAQAAMASFVSLMQGGKYPETAIYGASEIASAGNAIADELAEARGGRYPSFDEIAAELERRVAAKHAAIRGKQAAAAPRAEAPRRASPTLSNRDAAEKTRGVRALSEQERTRLLEEYVAKNLMPR
jgi:hypothetical protein